MGDKLIEEPSSYFMFEAKGMLQSSFNKLFEFLQKEILCDVVIQTGKKSIKCHRSVLASCSPYFQAMFTSPLTESHQSIVTIGDIDEITMEMLIKFAYTAKIELNVTNAQSLLHASSVLQLDVLAQACCNFMSLQLHPSNCLGIREFADQHGHFALVKQSDIFTKQQFRQVMLNEDFTTIGSSHLKELISSSDLCVDTEEQYNTDNSPLIHGRKDSRTVLPLGLIRCSYTTDIIDKLSNGATDPPEKEVAILTQKP